jgi:negative regulator of genetic competence, sporulation and motility
LIKFAARDRGKGGGVEFHLITADKLQIILSEEDMASLSLEYENMDYADLNTKDALLSLLERAKDEAGFNPKGAKLFIEVYPSESGGSVIYVTAMRQDPRRRGAPKGPSPVVFRFEDADTLLQGALLGHRLYGHRILDSALYLSGDDYLLILYPLDFSDRLSIYFFAEFGQMVGEGEVLASYTKEHGKELLAEKALDTLSEYFGDKDEG